MAVNQVPLTPLSLLKRAAAVYPARAAVVHGKSRTSFARFQERVYRLANLLRDHGIQREDRVAILAPNLPQVLEAHFGIPWASGVIVAINTRLSPKEVAYILEHSGSRVLLVDRQMLAALEPVAENLELVEQIWAIDDPENPQAGPTWMPARTQDLERLLAQASSQEPPFPIEDEWQTIAIDYTSGTTGSPKGVMYTHRGALLNAVNDGMQTALDARSVYLWTLPMFHCNGWCYSWAAPGLGATSICLRQVEPKRVRDLILREGVTHFCGAPVVLQMLAQLAETEPFRFERTVRAATGGAPPSPTLLAVMRRLNVDVTHLYGLTETHGPCVLCEVQDDWLRLGIDALAAKLARQGVAHALAGDLAVLTPDLKPVPPDGAAMGEVCLRGNTVMKGYFRDPEATEKAFAGGWFHTGDLGVVHPDGYVELKDRAKDIIISGGENISTIEVENVLVSHPDLLEAAVVSRPDTKWGEVPVAFVSVKPGRTLTGEAVIAFCRERLAHFKCPKEVVFETLPRTSTGKVQKFALRERMWAGSGAGAPDRRIQGA